MDCKIEPLRPHPSPFVVQNQLKEAIMARIIKRHIPPQDLEYEEESCYGNLLCAEEEESDTFLDVESYDILNEQLNDAYESYYREVGLKGGAKVVAPGAPISNQTNQELLRALAALDRIEF